MSEPLDLRQRIASLSVEQRAELERRLMDGAARDRARTGIPRRGPGAMWPVSFGQQRLWVLHQLEPGLLVYNLCRAIRLEGPLDASALAGAFDALIERHEALRTTFVPVDGEPWQRVGPARSMGLQVVDLSDCPAAERGAEVARHLRQEARQPFDLATDLMLRGRLLRLGHAEHVLAFSTHHIASDGLSSGILARELGALYNAFAAGEPSPLAELPIQYADYALWHRKWFEGVRDEQLAYWRRQLDGAPPTLDLPTDRPRPAVRTHRGARVGAELSADLMDAVRGFARGQRATLFMALLAAFKVVLSRHAGQPDIVVGTPTAGRTRMETEGLIGFFVNTLVLRTDLSGDPTPREALARMRETALGAYGHQEAPFERLVQELRPERLLDRGPLVQVSFGMLEARRAIPDLRGMTATPVEVESGVAQYDLAVSAAPVGARLDLRLGYSTDLFDEPTMIRMLGHYRVLLEGMVAEPDRRLSRISCLTDEERRRIVSDWNPVRRAAGARASSLHALVEAQAARTPGRVAAVQDDRELTYAELDRRANEVAHRLGARGIGAGARVGLCADRSLEMVVGMLAILKAGGAFVPLDPGVPARLKLMIEDSGIGIVLVDGRSAPHPPLPAVEVVAIDGGEAAPMSAPPSADRPEAAAYVLYTSGSTGQPKGVVVEHRQLLAYASAVVEQYGMGEGGGFAMMQPLTVDSCHTMVFPALGWGGTLHLIDRDRALDAAELAAYFRRRRIDFMKIAPTHLASLISSMPPADLLPARALILGGEASHWDLVDRLLASAPRCQIWNHYGPTETTVGVLTYRADTAPAAHREAAAAVPLGRPLGHARAYVLDSGGAPQPIGVPGEICVGGAAVTRGYLGRPALTAVQFVPDPFSGEEGARLYRTGDRGRFLPDGTLEFLGRTDDQVKIRGFRVELGEIEALLGEHPAIGERIVLAPPAASGDRELVAYVVAVRGRTLDAGEVREFLGARVPEVMVPSAVVVLDALPRSAQGKVNRSALAAPARDSGADAPYLPPATSVEETIAAIWAEILGLPRVGADGHFFRLGGHSLLAVRAIAQMRKALGVELPLRRLFETPTVAGLAAAVGDLSMAVPWSGGGPIAPAARGGPLPLSFSQHQFWLINQEQEDDPVYNSAQTVRVRGPLRVDAFRAALDGLVARHEILRTVYRLVDGEPMQIIEPPRAVDCRLVDLGADGAADGSWRPVVDEWAGRPFDLGRDLMLRALVVRLGPAEHIVVLNLHHIARDAASTAILASELAVLYEAALGGRPSPLPMPALQYADYATWQRGWLHGSALDGHIEFWRGRLAGAPAVLDLPTDRPYRPGRRSPSGHHSVLLAAPLARGLRAVGGRVGASPFMVLLAAFAALLHRYTGAEDILVGAAVTGRDRDELRQMVGCFLNTIALRIDLSGDPSFGDLLGRVRHTALEAYDHAAAPFPKVVEALRPARRPGRTPLFQVMLNMHDSDRTPHLPGLEVEPVPGADVGAMFDLMLFQRDAPGDGMQLHLLYAADLFDHATIERLGGHLQVLLEGAVADPERRASRLPLLTGAERRALASWSGAARPAGGAGCLHEMFEAQADARAAATAAVHAGRELSYGEIEERANRLAHHLRGLGAGPDVPVGLCVQRSLDMVVGVLGILKSGAGYVPLDPGYPAERLTYMMESARLPIVVSHRATAGRLPTAATARPPRVVCLDADAGAIAAQPATRPRGGALPGSLLYVLFTSGSSGRPKGVAMPHAPLVNLMRWQHERSGCGVGARTLQFAPYGFDVSCQELFATLGAGGTLVIVDDDTRLDPEALVEALVGARVERVFMPFVALEQLAQTALARDRVPATLREVITAGEALRVTPALAGLFGRLPGARLDNQYGPTECHVVSAHMLDGPSADWPALPPIGRPVANAALHVLAAAGDPLPVGVAGELWVGGAPLARGYVGRPDLTAERFVPDHVGGAAGALLYRTGDLARWTADGRLEYLGRADRQVKVRGHRVEPGEIEVVLRQAVPPVAEAVVVAREDSTGGRLVAYLRPAGPARPEPAALRAALRASLPDYMVPSAFEWLEEDWPLTSSGKVDRLALARRAPAAERAEPGSRRTAPSNPLEVELTGIWEEVLGVRPIGVNDDFFEHGGHSLLAVRMLRRVEQVCGRRVPVAALFAGATIRHLANVIRSEAVDFYRTPVTLVQQGARAPLFFLHGDYNGGGFYCIRLAHAIEPEQTFYALHPHGPDGRPVPATIEEMAVAHLGTVRRLQPTGPYYLGGHCNGGLIAFEMARQLREAGETVAFLAVLDASAMNSRLRSALWRVRRGANALASGGRYYARRARRVLGAGPSEWMPFVQRQVAARRRAIGAAPRGGAMAGEMSRAELARGDQDLDDAYWRAIRAYVPGRYDGRIAVFKAAEYRASRPDIGWGLVCDDVEAHEIPGTHLSFITRHVATLGERMRACLRAARGE